METVDRCSLCACFGARKEDAVPEAEKPSPRAHRNRAPARPAACELRPFAHPVSDALVLAAAERAERHHASRPSPGVMLAEVFAHMGFVYNGAATRQLRPRLDGLLADGSLANARRNGLKLWVLTSAGRRRLARARRRDGPVRLPESPQHRVWRHSRESAAERIDEYQRGLQALLDEASAVFAVGTTARSDHWFCLASRLRQAARNLGTAIYCLTEWPEPDDARADVDDCDDPGDGELDLEKRARLRYLRNGRRNISQSLI